MIKHREGNKHKIRADDSCMINQFSSFSHQARIKNWSPLRPGGGKKQSPLGLEIHLLWRNLNVLNVECQQASTKDSTKLFVTCVGIFAAETDEWSILFHRLILSVGSAAVFGLLFLENRSWQWRSCSNRGDTEIVITYHQLNMRNRHPFKDLHCGIADCDPLFFPVPQQSYKEDWPPINVLSVNKLIKTKAYQCRTLSTTCMTRLMSSFARLLVSALTDRDILIFCFH